jgi:hypothetical protein
MCKVLTLLNLHVYAVTLPAAIIQIRRQLLDLAFKTTVSIALNLVDILNCIFYLRKPLGIKLEERFQLSFKLLVVFNSFRFDILNALR